VYLGQGGVHFLQPAVRRRQDLLLLQEHSLHPVDRGGALLLMNKTHIHLRSASIQTYTFFTTGFPRLLSIRRSR
jgi:hypothetical protein